MFQDEGTAHAEVWSGESLFKKVHAYGRVCEGRYGSICMWGANAEPDHAGLASVIRIWGFIPGK